MITHFDTTTQPASSGKSNTNMIVGIIVVAALAYVGYRFVYIPYKNKKDEETDQTE